MVPASQFVRYLTAECAQATLRVRLAILAMSLFPHTNVLQFAASLTVFYVLILLLVLLAPMGSLFRPTRIAAT